MSKSDLFLLFLSVLIAAGLSFYHYLYKAKNKSGVTLFLAFLRFFSILGILVLLINPIIARKSIEIIKSPLPIVIDNSESIADLKADKAALETFETLSKNKQLAEKFDIQTYQFDEGLFPSDSINFKGKQTKIDLVAKNLKSIYKNQSYPTILISDGNQTSGEDFVFEFDPENKVYPIVAGDTISYLDLKIAQLNVNKYAFFKNKFPVEIFLNYSGTKSINTTFKISQGNTVLNKQTVAFSPNKKSASLTVLLPANKVGIQILKASITSNEQEKNSYNNTKNFAVEILDQKTEIALISSMPHPDLGAIKRSIETNAHRKVTIVNPLKANSLTNYNILILYQPNSDFKSVFEQNKKAKIDTWIITGNNTDFNFLNQNQTNLDFKMTGQKEDYLASFESQFNLFALEDIGFEQMPPLENAFGTIAANDKVNVLLSSNIRNIATNQPLFGFIENQGSRSAFLFGENIWKWRAAVYLNKKSFDDFDIFLDKTIQYLASDNSKKSLIVSYERFYNSDENIEITAQYFNKNYELDEKARLTISLTNSKTKQVKNFDLLRKANGFQVNLDGLSPGNYTFKVKELNSNSVYAGSFEVLDFDIEKQFVNPDLKKLNELAAQTKGKVFMPNQTKKLIKELLSDNNYKPTQKTLIKKSPMIDWIWLLILIAVLLATEWFVRKYNGLL